MKEAPELAMKWIFSAKKTISSWKFCPARERMRARLLVPGDGPKETDDEQGKGPQEQETIQNFMNPLRICRFGSFMYAGAGQPAGRRR